MVKAGATVLVFWAVAGSLPAFAEKAREAPTFSFAAQGGFLTHKSELAASNDTGTGVGYGIGFHAGEEHQVGVFIKNESAAVIFELNASKVESSTQDVVIHYRLGSFYLGGAISALKVKATRGAAEAATEIDAIGNGYGGNAGFAFRIGKNAAWFTDVLTGSYGETREANQLDFAIKSAMTIDTGVNFFVTRELLDITAGFKQKTIGLSLGESFAEVLTMTYLGLRLNVFF
jgi:hypothetical protein